MKNRSISRAEIIDDLKKLIEVDLYYQSSIYQAPINLLELARFPITNIFMALHDYTQNLIWDYMGEQNADDIELLCRYAKTFLDRVTALEDNELTEYTEVSELLSVSDMNVGGDGVLCRRISLAAMARAKLEGKWSDAEPTVNVNELAAYAGIQRTSVMIGLRDLSDDSLDLEAIEFDVALEWAKTHNKHKEYREAKYNNSINDIDSSKIETEKKVTNYFLKHGGSHATIERILSGDKKGIQKLAKETNISRYWIAAKTAAFVEAPDVDMFTSYLWRFNLCTTERLKYEEALLDEKIRVPVSKDGSVFHPGLRLGKGYQIGQRNKDQHYVDDYWEALKELEKMPTARFRRPSKESGVPGTVAAVDWILIPKKELISMGESKR